MKHKIGVGGKGALVRSNGFLFLIAQVFPWSYMVITMSGTRYADKLFDSVDEAIDFLQQDRGGQVESINNAFIEIEQPVPTADDIGETVEDRETQSLGVLVGVHGDYGYVDFNEVDPKSVPRKVSLSSLSRRAG